MYNVRFGNRTDPRVYKGFLILHHIPDIEMVDSRVDIALHEVGAIIIFNHTLPNALMQANTPRETLLLEVADGKVVGIGEEVRDTLSLHMLLQVVHEACPKTFNLQAHITLSPIAIEASIHTRGEKANSKGTPKV